MVKPILKGFVHPKEGPKVECGTLPIRRTKKEFDPNAYKLLAKVRYDPQSSNTLGKLINEVIGSKVYDLNKIQRILKENGHSVETSRTGLRYKPSSPM